MKLGILEAGRPPATLSGYGSYPDMFRKMFGATAYEYEIFDVQAGAFPDDVSACPAYLVTGSACGVYDDLPWIAQLMAFLREAKGRAALVGICFGHQIMAEAFGGKVIRSHKGWGAGAQRYEVWRPQPWSGKQRAITLPASHQDQVVALPPAVEVVAGNGFAPYGLLAYRDQPAISLQLHPEFSHDYAVALTEIKRDKGLSEEDVERALATLHQPLDRAVAAGWITTFLASAVE